jgi:hypothetical protein
MPFSRYSLRIMLTYLRRLAASIMRRSPFHPLNPPSDPYAIVRQPRPVRPGGRSSAVALREPDPPRTVHAVGRNRTIAFALIATAGLLAAHPLRAQSTGQSADKPFVSGGRIDINLSGGDYEIRAAADNRIRVSLTRNPGSTKVEVAATGSQATVKVTDTPHNNFSAIVEVPTIANLTVHLTGGNLTITGLSGNKDVDSYGGNVTIVVPDPNEYASVDASVKAGDINARAFGGSKSGLFQTFTWSGKGKYTLRARLGAGNLELK